MNVTSLNSIVFHTDNLQQVRNFYGKHLGLTVGTFMKNGKEVPDESESYVNFNINGFLLCFEKGETTNLGTVILNVNDLEETKSSLINNGIGIVKEAPGWIICKDPDGRSVILEPEAQVNL